MGVVKLQGRRTKPGLKFARVLFFGKGSGHRPSSFNLCVASKLKGKSHPAAPEGAGGMRNTSWQKEFIKAAMECGAHISESVRRKWGL